MKMAIIKFGFTVIAVFHCFSSTGLAADHFWSRSGVGPHLWHSPANWSPQGNPGNGDTANFNLGQSYAVETSFDWQVDEIRANNGTPTINIGFDVLATEAIIVGQSGQGGGQLQLRGGDFPTNNVTIGQGASTDSSLTLSGGQTDLNVATEMHIGTSSDGAVTVNQSAKLDVATNLFVAESFDGDLDVTMGVVRVSGTMHIANSGNSNGDGSVRIDGPLSFLRAGDVAIGHNGELTLSNGADAGVFGSIAVSGNGKLGIDTDAALNVDGDIMLGPAFMFINGGTVEASSIQITPNLTSGFHWTSGDVVLDSAAIGRPFSPFRSGLTLTDLMSLDLGSHGIQNGTLEVANQTLTLDGGQLVARRTVLENGVITSTGQLQSSSLSQGHDGIVGHGTINTPNDEASAFTFDANDFIVDGTSVAQPIHLTGYVNGDGEFREVVFEGTHAPGFSTAAINVQNVMYGSTATLQIEVEGIVAGSGYDQINSTGDLVLDGTIEVLLPGAFTPSTGDTFDILTATGQISGQFSSEVLPALNGGLSLNLEYNSNVVQLVVEGLLGDFDGDGIYGGSDVDALVAEIAAGTSDPFLDINGDGVVDLADRDAWLAAAGGENLGPGKVFLLGDANLDGVVDGADFLEWNAHKFTSTAAWTAGDFNADGVVDGGDFLEWNGNKFMSSDANSVPEPLGLVCLLLPALLCTRRLRASQMAAA